MLYALHKSRLSYETIYCVTRLYEAPSSNEKSHTAFFSELAVKALQQENSNKVYWFKDQDAAEKELDIHGSFYGIYELHLPKNIITTNKGTVVVDAKKIEPAMMTGLQFHQEAGIKPPSIKKQISSVL